MHRLTQRLQHQYQQEGSHPTTHPFVHLGLVSSFGTFYMLAPGRCPGEASSLALSATPPVGFYSTYTFGASRMLAPGSFPGEALPLPCLVGHAAHCPRTLIQHQEGVGLATLMSKTRCCGPVSLPSRRCTVEAPMARHTGHGYLSNVYLSVGTPLVRLL